MQQRTSKNPYTISDIFQFSEDVRNIPVFADHILVSYDVTALFTNVPAHETRGILTEKAFAGNWFNNTYDLNLTEDQLMELLKLAICSGQDPLWKSITTPCEARLVMQPPYWGHLLC